MWSLFPSKIAFNSKSGFSPFSRKCKLRTFFADSYEGKHFKSNFGLYFELSRAIYISYHSTTKF